MTNSNLAYRRMHAQHLTGMLLDRPEDVVQWLGAVQAQDYAGAKWALGLRTAGVADDAIERAYAAGTILRTHVLRPTWHFVTPADIRWMLALSAPRVKAASAYMCRQLELDDALFSRSNTVIAQALQGGAQLTRAELGAALARAGITADGGRLGHILHRAEIDGIVCSGPRRGKQFTYMLLEERAPHARVLERDKAVAELTRRYYTGHGPATVQDFVWWSGLTAADAKAGLESVGSNLAHEVIDGTTYWFSSSAPPTVKPTRRAYLLPTYDEFLVGFASFAKALTGGRDLQNQVFNAPVVVGGQVVGSWKRTFQKGAVVVELAPYGRLTPAESEALTRAAHRYGEFLGMPAELA